MPVGLSQDVLTRIYNMQWGGGGRFAVCGYDGNFEHGVPVFFGVGAHSDDGKSWTSFRVFENGTAVSIFHMSDPKIVVVGGNTNDDSGFPSVSTAELKTIVGSGANASGGTSPGRNAAWFGSIGYHKQKKLLYAVENSGALHTFELGMPASRSSRSEEPKEPQILWAGPHSDKIAEPVYDCSTTGAGSEEMKFKGSDGKTHTLRVTDKLSLDGADITPPGIDSVASAAGGTNDEGEIIIIATGYHLKDDENNIPAGAWWSIEGKSWNEISGLWAANPNLQAAAMATAVPNSIPNLSTSTAALNARL
jgi:hypothetical protein